MYQLYIDKDNAIIKIEKMKEFYRRYLNNEQITSGEVFWYNDFYFFCSNRKNLKEKAIELKESWITEAKLNLEKYENIKI